MEFLNCEIPALCVIGKEGVATGEGDIAQAMWQEANAHFAEVEPLALRDETGAPAGFWGAMSDCSRSFLPWKDGFSRGAVPGRGAGARKRAAARGLGEVDSARLPLCVHQGGKGLW